MAHEIRKTDKVLSVREPMWHGLEDLLSEYPTREEAEKLVHPFSVLREDIYRRVPVITPTGELTHQFQLIEDEQINVRSDTDMVLAPVPRDRPEIQPSELWDIVEEIQRRNKGVLIETAGSLRDGRDIWILLKLDEEITIKGDPQGTSFSYQALQNSYVPGKACRFQNTNVRIQCWNTSSYADFMADMQNMSLSLAHTTNMRERIEEITEFLGEWRRGIDLWKDMKEAMANLKVNMDQTVWFVDQFIPMPNTAVISDRVQENVKMARAELTIEMFNGFSDGVRGTALGLFEAASSYQGHVRAATSKITRFKRQMLTPDRVLFDAANLALEAVNV
jgi:phage/plasmid-like protein (TIGR03299 family)